MSVVAWDGKTLAADRQGTCSGMRLVSEKCRRLSTGEVLAWTGGEAQGLLLAQWYEAGADPAKWPEFQKDKDDWTRLIVAHKTGCGFYERFPVQQPVLEGFMAFGAGRDYAMAAMALGASARKAVEVTCRFSVDCGYGVDVHEL